MLCPDYKVTFPLRGLFGFYEIMSQLERKPVWVAFQQKSTYTASSRGNRLKNRMTNGNVTPNANTSAIDCAV